jgi:hypothetical protein
LDAPDPSLSEIDRHLVSSIVAPSTAGRRPGRARAPRRALVLMLGAGLLGACTESSITVAEADLEEPGQTTSSLTDSSDTARDVFYANDESVTLGVEFDVNFVAVYKSFYAWWYFPDGRIYLRQPVRNRFGTHLSLVASMAIRGEPPATRPGVWKVRLTLRDRLLAEHEFEIRAGPRPAAGPPLDDAGAPTTAAPVTMPAAPAPSAPSAAAPLCPDPGSLAGWCSWEAPEEGGSGPAHLEPAPGLAVARRQPRRPAGAPAQAAAAVATTGSAPAGGLTGTRPVPAATEAAPAASAIPPAPVSARAAGTAPPVIPLSVLEAARARRLERERAASAPAVTVVRTSPDEPLCPDPGEPAGACTFQAPQERAPVLGGTPPAPAAGLPNPASIVPRPACAGQCSGL